VEREGEDTRNLRKQERWWRDTGKAKEERGER
jgi:hypothetical protein